MEEGKKRYKKKSIIFARERKLMKVDPRRHSKETHETKVHDKAREKNCQRKSIYNYSVLEQIFLTLGDGTPRRC